MGRTWKPGDVVSMRNGDLDIRGFIDTDGRPYTTDKRADGIPADRFDLRPLVVIDPEDRDQVVRLMSALTRALGPEFDVRAQDEAMQAALRSLVADPKPEEPTGLGAVVEDADGDFWVYAGMRALVDGETREWVHASKRRWYAEIAAVRVLSDGVTA